MKKVTKQGQSFIDKVVEQTGNIDNALEMAVLNGVSLTASVAIGTELLPNEVTNKRVAAFFNKTNSPATNLTVAEVEEIENIGIGEMAISSSFIVR